MSDPPANDVAPELSSSSGSDSDSEAWVTAYDSEFEMTLSDIDEDLLNAMRNFDVGEGPPGHADSSDSDGFTLDDETRYEVSTGATTSDWSEAAQAQRQGAHVRALVKRKKTRSQKSWYVIIVGRLPGVYRANEADAHVTGVPNLVYHGYTTRERAEDAWAAAQAASMVGPPDSQMPRNPVLTPLPLDSEAVPDPSPLSATGRDRRFYVVYRGRVTGVFNSSLEAGLSVVGVEGNAHESERSYKTASRKYRRAIDRGEVQAVEG